MISKFAFSTALAALALTFGAGSASADWNRPGAGYGAPPSSHRNFEPPRYRENSDRYRWQRHEGEYWGWRHRHARWSDDRGSPRRDWRYD